MLQFYPFLYQDRTVLTLRQFIWRTAAKGFLLDEFDRNEESVVCPIEYPKCRLTRSWNIILVMH